MTRVDQAPLRRGCGSQHLTRSVVSMHRALVIEDEVDLAELVGLHLRDLQLQVSICRDGQVGLERALSGSWRLLVLDLSLPRVDGLEICRRLRSADHHTPLLIISARGSEQERIIGLDSGADDYLSKPFSVLELIARVRAILRRVESSPSTGPARPQVIRSGEVEIDRERRQARRAGVTLELTAREFDLLAHLVANPGKVFSRAQLLDQVWGLTYDAYEHTVSSHINRLRAKLEPDPAEPRYLLTSWGAGYCFAEK